MNSPAIATVAGRARPTPAGVGSVVTAIGILWFASVVAAHYAGLLRAGSGNLPVPFGVAVAVPIVIFFASYWAVPRFHAAVLDVEQRVDELARMLGGIGESRGVREHARDLLGQPAC